MQLEGIHQLPRSRGASAELAPAPFGIFGNRTELLGIGAGKSTFSLRRFADTHIRINKHAIGRNHKREGKKKIPVPAILGTQKKLQPPRRE